MINFIIGFIIAIIGGCWRQWLGGSFNNISRFYKLIVLFLIFSFIYYIRDYQIIFFKDWRFYCAYLSFMRFWNRTHGDYFLVNDNSKDEARSWWVDKCLQLIYGKDGYYYFNGNVMGLLIGYSAYSILTSIFISNIYFSICGLIVACSYGMCGKLFPNKWYTKYAEYINGFFVFFILYLCLI